MSQSVPFQPANNRSPLRIGQILLTVLTLLTFALGSLLLSLVWLGVGVTTTGKVPGADGEVRAFLFIIVWPVTMLTVWVLSTSALLLAKRWLLASFSLPAAFAILYGVWFLVAQFLLTTSGVMFTALFILLNIGAIWLASWFLRSKSRQTCSHKRSPCGQSDQKLTGLTTSMSRARSDDYSGSSIQPCSSRNGNP